MSDSELMQCKKDLPMKNEQINKIAQKYEVILQTPIQNAEMLMEVKDVDHQYERLSKSKTEYITLLNDAMIQKDVYKQKLFNESKLNIRLEKFSGYDSVDFYTFKTDFKGKISIDIELSPVQFKKMLRKRNSY